MKSSISILVVDDEPALRNMLGNILTREGYQVHTVEDGQQALEFLKEQPVSIMISDMRMAPMDGAELVSRVKKEYPDVGVIVMTAFGDSYTVRDALLLGADEYITKPFKNYEISLVVERAYWRLLLAANRVDRSLIEER